ncbi:tripartite motif-containing protein 35-like [Notolabrus celidotus]|uniref:tripartite motif-containing protein 35-like n=1 Tax=Notolabrus celidotus TaxID=1203425 RepID=UPI00149068D4|nr:tripartite motif-containing protein 35-like [Notolabrus celidotus]
MASRSLDDLSCPVCQEIFKNPVVLSCSHSFCKDCLQRWWRTKQSRECPCCKRRSSKSDPPRNLALKNLIEVFSQEGDPKSPEESEALCSLHAEKLKLFCLDHQEPVCVVCRDSRMHNNHRFRPIDEAAVEQKEEIQKFLKPFQERLKLFEQVKGTWDLTAKHLKVQATNTESKIKGQFKKLHKFLEEEEEARICALREEEKQKSQMMKEKIDALNTEIAALSATIRVTQQELRAEDISFLQNYKTAVKRVQQCPPLDEPEVVSGALIDEVKHLGNLRFNIWNKMRGIVSYSPLILDPNTADPELVLSEDLTSVRAGERQQLPKNLERTKFSCSVLSSEGFDSGTHSWEVAVGANKDWELGVLGEFIQKDGRLQSGLWRIMFSSGKFTAFCTSGSEKDLPVEQHVQRIRVHLDFDGGKLSFCDVDTNTHIHTFTHTFTDTLFPYIYTENQLPVKILPLKISVKAERQSQKSSRKSSPY